MSDLPNFVRSFSDNDRLINAAMRITARVEKIIVDTNGKELQMILSSDGEIPDGHEILAFENELRGELGVEDIRIRLKGDAFHNIAEAVTGRLSSWIMAGVARENPMLCALIEEIDLHANGTKVAGTVRCPADPALVDELSVKAELFTEQHLPESCYFELCALPGESDRSERERIEQYEKKLQCEIREIMSREASLASKKNDVKTENGSINATKAGIPVKTDRKSSSWESRAEKAASETKAEMRTKYKRQESDESVWGRMSEVLPFSKIGEMNESTGKVFFEGKIEIEEMKLTKSGQKVCAQFFVTDDSGSVPCVFFLTPREADRFSDVFTDGGFARIHADVCFDARYTKDLSASVTGVRAIPDPEKRKDAAQLKRVELHCHSKMSEKDGVIDVSALVTEAARLGHRACALTDHGVVQGFPEASEATIKVRKMYPEIDFKMIYGMEGYLVDDGPCPIYFPDDRKAPVSSYVALLIETTGTDPLRDSVRRVYAARFTVGDDGYISCVDTFFEELSKDADALETAETNNPTSDRVSAMERLSIFLGDSAICGTDILRSLSFLRYAGFDVDVEKHERHRIKFNPVAAEIRDLCDLIANHNEVSDPGNRTENPEQPEDVICDPRLRRDAEIMAEAIRLFKVNDLSELNSIAGKASNTQILSRKQTVYHIVLLAQNTLGLYHLYRLVSDSHLCYFSHRPRIPKSLLRYFRDGLILGSACERGEVFSRIRTHYTMNNLDFDLACRSLAEDSSFLHVCAQYDYLEIQPLTNNSFFLRDPESGIPGKENLIDLNRLVLFAGDTLGIPVCATTDAHFLEKKDGEFRKYLLLDMEYKDAQNQGDLYYRTTEEMLEEFSYLGMDRAEQVVVLNPNAIADRIIPGLKPFPQGSYPPIIDTAADEITRVTLQTVADLYTFRGTVAPIVEERVSKELDSIIGNGFAVMYYIAYMLVKKSNEDGYIVGSRGSVGSSLVATLCGISEVNPLPPHYRCPECGYSEFDTSGSYGSGYDLPQKDCPYCAQNMVRDGQEIPFETFLGFYGDKQPDIDLNFSSEYQSRAHHYVEELFGTSHTFRAGTIGCFAEKNAIAVVNKICEQNAEGINRAELRRRSRGLIGVKRTTGQHPGGIVVVPKEMDIYEFTPIQHPANKADAGVVTTHFDFNAMHDTILKLDILGHYDPTVLRMLSDLTGVDVRTIPIPEPRVMSLFSTTEALGIMDKNYVTGAATLGLSEMGTFMARDMIAETRPSKFFDLVQLMGLSHGTDVWKGNAQDLIRKGVCTLENVIGCRDSIMTTLIQRGIPNKEAFDIMERVRKGKGLLPEQEVMMKEFNVPEWYIESCKIIKYMFPKAHAAAYAISSLRIAWFKVYYPEEYYCAFFSIRAEEFDGDTMCRGIDLVRSRRKELHEGYAARKQTEKAQYYLYELIEEMYERGIEFVPFDLEKSEADRFKKLSSGKILPPINAIGSISTAMARAICTARDEKPFSTREELLIRSGIGPSALEKLAASGILDSIPESVQIDLFSLL